MPFREDADLVLGPTSKHRWAYACSKLIDEFLALAYWKEKKLPVIIARLFNTVGPRQTGPTDVERDECRTRLAVGLQRSRRTRPARHVVLIEVHREASGPGSALNSIRFGLNRTSTTIPRSSSLVRRELAQHGTARWSAVDRARV